MSNSTKTPSPLNRKHVIVLDNFQLLMATGSIVIVILGALHDALDANGNWAYVALSLALVVVLVQLIVRIVVEWTRPDR